MHPEIEKLIDLIIIDGQISEKERDVIIKKAKELGVDLDEVIITLDAKLYQKEASQTKEIKDEKYGNRKKCPYCGAPAKSFSDKCDNCSEDFRFNTLGNLTKNLTDDDLSNFKKISRQSIPINKEELIEFATFSIGNANNNALGLPERNAWYSKFIEAKNKLKLAYQIEFNPFKSDNNIAFMGGLIDGKKQLELENELSGKDKTKKKIRRDAVGVFLIFCMSAFFYLFTIHDQGIEKEKNRLELIMIKVNDAVSKKDFDVALTLTSQLKWGYSDWYSDEIELIKSWDEKRESQLNEINKLH